MFARTSTLLKSVATIAVLGAVLLPVAASAHDNDYDDDGYVVVHHDRYRGGSCAGNTTGGVVTGAVVGGAAAAVPGAVVGAMIGGAIGSDTHACRYDRRYAYDSYYDDDGYDYQDRGRDPNAYDRGYNRRDGYSRRDSYSRSDYGYRDPYYGRRYRSDW